MELEQDISQIVDIHIKSDGVYLEITMKPDVPRPTRMEIIQLIESYGVMDVDFVGLNEALKEESAEHMEFKISSNTNIIQETESAGIEIAKDRMEAYITFSPPLNKGRNLTLDEVMDIIKKANVNTAVPEKVEAILKTKRYERKYTIAEGTNPVAGKDGALQYHFDNSNLRPKPQILDDGSVNFRQLGLIRLCNRGDVLVTSIPPADGVDGLDVHGNVIPFVKGRTPIPLPKGKNTVISEDGLHLIADASGQLIIADKKISISPTLELKGNVDNSTGNIDFNGSVSVRGNVISGFTVKATGNIEVMGVCEAATIITEGSIVLGNGAQGMDKGKLTAGGDITAKFIESCSVTAGGNVFADSILNSKIRCDGDVVLSGKNGLLVGGSLVAGNKLSAKTIGSPMGTNTEVETGNNPQSLGKFKQLNEEYEKMKIDYDKCDKAVNTLTDLKSKNMLNEDKKNLLLRMINMKIALREKMNKAQSTIEELSSELSSNAGTISASKVIRSGVKVTIGNSQLTVRDEIQNCTLRNNGEKITIGPCI